jgi:hypothetical protein
MSSVEKIIKEIDSPLNRVGAQQTFSVHDPNLEQLIQQYISSGGFQRCANSMDFPRALIRN